MEQFFANENMISGNNETVEVFINDVILEDKYEENANVKIKTRRNLEDGFKKLMKINFKKLHA
jgi:hypothetical protein